MKCIQISDCNIVELVEALKNGQTIVYPTETCYGLGCDATNESAVNKVFEIKGRVKEKSVILLVSKLADIARWADISPLLEKISNRYWSPFSDASEAKSGPVTVVIPAKPNCGLPQGVLSVDGTLAFRVSTYPFARDLCAALGKPIVSTSANLAGGSNPYSIAEVVSAFSDHMSPDIIIDAGTLPSQLPSTVVKLNNNDLQILRQGEIIIDRL